MDAIVAREVGKRRFVILTPSFGPDFRHTLSIAIKSYTPRERSPFLAYDLTVIDT